MDVIPLQTTLLQAMAQLQLEFLPMLESMARKGILDHLTTTAQEALPKNASQRL